MHGTAITITLNNGMVTDVCIYDRWGVFGLSVTRRCTPPLGGLFEEQRQEGGEMAHTDQ